MTDPDLDRALADALDVEPRPDFLARVRTEIARQPAPSVWPAWWQLAAAGAAVAMAVVMVYRTEPGEPSAPLRIASRVDAPLVPVTAPPIAISREAPMPAREEPRTVGAVPLALPAPQISPDDAEALRYSLAGASDGLFAPIAARDDSAPLAVSGIDLAPIEVMPLAQMAQADSGEHQ